MKRFHLRLAALLLCLALLGLSACGGTTPESSSPGFPTGTKPSASTFTGKTEESATADSTAVTLPSIATSTTVGDPTKKTSATTNVMPGYPDDLGNGTTYYVSASQGNDQNDGKSPATPFKTVEAVNKLTLKAGDNVLFRRGDVFAGAYLTPRGSGNTEEGCWITLDAYGVGENPVFQGGDLVAPAISLNHMMAGRGYRIRHIDIDRYPQGICVKKTSMELAFDGLEIADCTITNITLSKEFSDGDRAMLPNGAALAFGLWLFNVKNVTVTGVTIENADCPIQIQGGNAVFDRVDMFNCPMQGVMIYGMTGDVDYATLMNQIGNVTFQNSRIRYVGYRCGSWGSTGFMIENIVGCTVKNVEISHVTGAQGLYDACALDWEQSNINCVIEEVYAHDNQGQLLLAMEHGDSTGNSRGNTVKNCVSVNNGLHGTTVACTFLHFGPGYQNANQVIRVENCVDIGREGSVPFRDGDRLCTATKKVQTESFLSGLLAVEAGFDGTAPLADFAVTEKSTVADSRLVLQKGSSVRTGYTGSEYTVSTYLKGAVALEFLCPDSQNGYVWAFFKDKLVAQKRVNGKLTTLKTVPVAGLSTSGWFHVRVETVGNTLKTYVDGVPVSTLTDTTFTTGEVGFSATGNGAADALLVWKTVATPRTAEIYIPDRIAPNGDMDCEGWNATGFDDWGRRIPGVGWGWIADNDAVLEWQKANVSVTGYDTVQVMLMNGTDSGTVYLEFSTDSGKTWHSKPFETAFCGEDAFWAFRNGSLEAYTVDMGNVSAWMGTVTDLRLRFTGNTGLVVLHSLTVYAD